MNATSRARRAPRLSTVTARVALAALLIAAFATGNSAPAGASANDLVVINHCDVSSLVTQVKNKLGIPAANVRIGYVLIYSDQESFGQKLNSGSMTGPVLCVPAGSTVNRTTPFPTSDVNIFETGTSTRVRISTSPNASDPADVVNCEGFNGTEKCALIDR